MLWLTRLTRRARMLVRRASIEHDMDDEMRFHIESEIGDLIASGIAPDEARRVALLRFGGVERFKEQSRDSRGVRALEDLSADVRYALRVLRRAPGFTTAAVLTLALGIGVNSAIFSVVHGVLLRPLPYPEPDRLAVAWERNVARAQNENVVSVGNFEAWRERNRSFESLAALVPAPKTLTGGRDAEHVVGAEVSASYFDALRAQPALGRAFSDREAEDGARVIVLSHDFWRTRLGGERGALGRTVVLDDERYSVIGIMPATFLPPRFGWLTDHDFWIPFRATEGNRQWGRFLLVLGRLREGVSVDDANHELATIARQLALENDSNQGWSAGVVGLAQQVTGDVRTALVVLLAAVGLLLLMAVANVANLMLSQLRRGEHELAVRLAIGASRGRLLRQLLTQSAVLGLIGAGVGLILAVGGVRALLLSLPADVPRAESIRVDGVVLLFTLGTSVLATLAFGVVPAVGGTRLESTRAFHAAPARVSSRLGSGDVIVAEIALALVLTLVAGLTTRSLVALRSVALGFDASNVLALRIALPPDRYPEADQRRQFFSEALERVRALPGVEAAAMVSLRPLGQGEGSIGTTVIPDHQPNLQLADAPVADVRYADQAYFRTLRIAVREGRVFDESDRDGAVEPAVINATMARLLWPDRSSIGRRMSVNLSGGITAEVIGVVEDVHLAGPRVEPRSTVYMAADRVARSNMDVVIRGTRDAPAPAPAVREVIRALDPALPVFKVASLEEYVSTATARDRFTMLLLTSFALVSLLLAAVGIYGVLAGDVVRRRKEIGIRVALGARAATVILLILRRCLLHSVAGIAIGLVAALGLSRFMRALLFEVTTTDPASYAAVTVVLLLVALVAALIPAVRAARIAPMTAIRSD